MSEAKQLLGRFQRSHHVEEEAEGLQQEFEPSPHGRTSNSLEKRAGKPR